MMKDYWQIIDIYFPKGSKARDYYIPHVESVTKTALNICDKKPQLNADRRLVETASMLHDIGICLVHAPEIGCYGEAPYIQHGIMGAKIVKKEGFGEIASFCESHIGVGGFSKKYIKENKLPLPERDMIPKTIEEKIVAFADTFFSKSQSSFTTPKSIEDIRLSISRHGCDRVPLFNEWVSLFLK